MTLRQVKETKSPEIRRLVEESAARHDPPRRTNGKRKPFEGRSGDRLAKLAGLRDHEELRSKHDVRNLLRRYPGKSGRIKGDAFPMRRAKNAAKRTKLGAVSLLVGRGGGRAFGV